MPLTLEQSIIATLSYFDIFEYPLTLFEIWKNLIMPTPPTPPIRGDASSSSPLGWVGGIVVGSGVSNNKSSLTDIKATLNNKKLKTKISQKNGFYFLNGRDICVSARQQRYYIADKKFKKAKKIAYLLSKIPYIKMIAVCNSLGFSNATENSDIDFFIITKQKRIWISRLFAVGLIKILNLRPKQNKTKNKICLSFFVDEKNLNLEKFKIAELDVYLIYWTTQLTPIYNQDKIYEKFWAASKWVEKYLPNRVMYEVVDRRNVGTGHCPVLASNFFLIDKLEKLSKKIQLKIMNPNLKKLMNKDTRVVVNDGVLKLYAVDRREEYLRQWLDSTTPTPPSPLQSDPATQSPAQNPDPQPPASFQLPY